MFEDPQRYEQLNELCSINLKAINPKIVIASGKFVNNLTVLHIVPIMLLLIYPAKITHPSKFHFRFQVT